MSRNTLFPIVILVLFSISFSVLPGYTQTIVVPPQFEDQAGSPAESLFLCAILPNGLRIQALYPGDDLVAGTIGGFSIRTIEGFPGVSSFVIPNITVIMSTTAVGPGELSNIFADNIGPDAQTVFSGELNIGAIPACNTSPCPFDIPVTLQTSFDYNPSSGNLLLYLIVPSCMNGMVPPFISIDSTTELDAILATNSNATEGSPALWNITQFSYLIEPKTVPTLSEWGIIAMVAGFALIGFFVVRRCKAAL